MRNLKLRAIIADSALTEARKVAKFDPRPASIVFGRGLSRVHRPPVFNWYYFYQCPQSEQQS